MNRQFLKSALASAATFALGASLLAVGAFPAHAAPASDAIVASGSGGALAVQKLLPVIESELGVGSSLNADKPIDIALPGVTNGSVLVRLSALSPQEAAEISVGGVPALSAAAGQTASTTVLAKAIDGRIKLSSSADADIRVEVAATFSEGNLAPGGTTALADPVLRADSKDGVGLTEGSDGSSFGLGVVGTGGVPSTAVRYAYITVVVADGSNHDLHLGEEKIALNNGVNVFNTLAPVSEQGTIDLRSSGSQTKVYVRGYVQDDQQNDAAQSIQNGLNELNPQTALTAEVSADSPALLDVGAATDASHAVIEVSSSASSETTFLDVGHTEPGRGRGVMLDENYGALNQLTIVELDENGLLPLATRFGQAEVSVRVLATVAGNEQRQSAAPQISLTSPEQNAQVDLTDVATFTIEGNIASGRSTLERIEVLANGASIGTASAIRTESGYEFSYQTSVPESGEHNLEFKASFRDGKETQTKLDFTAQLPNDSEILISEEIVVLEGEEAPDVQEISPEAIRYSADPEVLPGQYLVGRDPDTAAEGYLREVLAVELDGDDFVVTTAPAQITDVILQADVSQQVGMITDSGAQLFPQRDIEQSEIVVDVEQSTATAGTLNLNDPALTIDAEYNERVGHTVSLDALLEFSKEGGTSLNESEAEHNDRQGEVKAAGNISLSGKTELSVALVFELKVSLELGWFQSPTVSLDKFSVALERGLETKVAANAHGTFSAEWSQQLANWNIGTVTFMLGPVPVVITSTAEVTMAAQAQAEVEAKLSWTGKEHQRYGFEYSNGQLKAISPWPPVQNGPVQILNGYSVEEEQTAVLTGSASASAGPELDFMVSIYDAAGPYISAAAVIGAEASFDAQDDIKWEVYLEGTVGVGVRLKLPIIDEVLLDEQLLGPEVMRIQLLTGSVPWDEFWKFDDPNTPPVDEDKDEEIGLDPIEIPEYSFEGSSLRATLYWDNESDLDLHVREPSGEWINYANRGPSATGGQLDIDAFAACSSTQFDFAGGLENVYWDEGSTAEPGSYLIEIDEWSRCGFDEHAKWVLKVYVDEQLRFQQSGNSEQQFSFNLQSNQFGSRTGAEQSLVPQDAAQHPEGEKVTE